MSKLLSLSLCGSLNGLHDTDFNFTVSVSYFINTKGNYSPRAEDPEEYYGRQYVEYEVMDVYDDSGTPTVLSGADREIFLNKYDLDIEHLVWDEMVERQNDIEYY